MRIDYALNRTLKVFDSQIWDCCVAICFEYSSPFFIFNGSFVLWPLISSAKYYQNRNDHEFSQIRNITLKR